MIATTWKPVAIPLLAVGFLGIGTLGSVAKDEKTAGPAAPAAAGKSDRFGDALPEGALARMGTVRWRHSAAVSFVGYTSAGKQLVTASADGFFRVWDVASGKVVRRFGQRPTGGGGYQVMIAGGPALMMQQGGGGSVALSADGMTLAAGGMDGVVRLWDVAAGKELRTLGTTGNGGNAGLVRMGAVSLAFAPDGKTLATRGGDQTIRLWNVANGKETRQLVRKVKAGPGNQVVFFGGVGGGSALVFAPDGKSIVSAGVEFDNGQIAGMIRIYDVVGGNERHQIKGPNNGTMGGLAISADSKILAVGGGNGVARLYDLATAKELRQVGQQRPGSLIIGALFAPTGNVLALRALGGPSIQLWDAVSGKELRQLGGHVAVNPVGGGVVFVGGFGGTIAPPQTCAFSPDGKQLAEVSSGNTIRLWDVASGKEILPAAGAQPASGHQGGVSSLAVSGDGKVLTTFGSDHTLRQWDVASGQELRQVTLPNGTTTVVLAAGGKLAACQAGLSTVHLLDVASGKTLRTIQPPNQPAGIAGMPFGGPASVALSPDGKLLALRGMDQAIRVYETASGKELRTLSEQPAKAAPNGQVVVNFGMRAIGGTIGLVFSPDNAALATVGSQSGGAMMLPQGGVQGGNNGLRLWQVTQGSQPRPFSSNAQGILALAFTPDGRTIVTANADHSLSLWEVLTGKEYLQIKPRAAAQPAAPPAAPGRAAVAVWSSYGMGGNGSTPIAMAPDGRTLAVGNADHTVSLWDLRSGKELGQFKGHDGPILALAFAPDSRTVLSGSGDTTALVWDGKRLIRAEQTPPVALNDQQVEALWKDLAADPVTAFRALGTLRTAPKQAVALCQQHLQPAAGVDDQRIDQLVAELDNPKFGQRQKAMQELEKLGELAQPALQKSLAGPAPLEVRRRVEKLLEHIVNDQTPATDVLRALRALQVLEQAGTPEARLELQRLAGGAAGAKLTRHAVAALKRLDKGS